MPKNQEELFQISKFSIFFLAFLLFGGKKKKDEQFDKKKCFDSKHGPEQCPIVLVVLQQINIEHAFRLVCFGAKLIVVDTTPSDICYLVRTYHTYQTERGHNIHASLSSRQNIIAIIWQQSTHIHLKGHGLDKLSRGTIIVNRCQRKKPQYFLTFSNDISVLFIIMVLLK